MPPLIGGCRWINSLCEEARTSVETLGLEVLVGFPVKRLFWLTEIAPGQWRGRHAHRESFLATFAVLGGCRMTLDDGEKRQVVDLNDDGPGLVVPPWVWHDLVDFLPTTVILVAASTLYDEAEYIRDYETFLREAKERSR
jgi:hypothetical protein